MKKLKEERQIEELKKLQVSAGLIPEAHLQRLDWMYQGPECTSDITTAEEYLLGKPIKDSKPEDKKHFTPVFQESYSNPQNEIFTKIHEDPLFSIKREEHNKRKEIEDNPYKMKLLLKEVEKNIKKRKKDKKEKKEKKSKKQKKEKKEKKEKKSKHNRKHSSSRSSSESTEKRFKTPNLETLRITTPSMLNKSLATSESFGLVDKNGNKLSSSHPSNRRISDLRPDETLYRERQKLFEKESDLRKRQFKDSSMSIKDLSKEERERRIAEMEKKAQLLDYQKSIISNERDLRARNEERHRPSGSHKPDFLKNVEREAYLDGKLSMSDKVKRNTVNNMKMD